MALVVVLWIVAALSLMVTGLTVSVRGETATATAARRALEGRALGEAGANLVLQRLSATQTPLTRATVEQFEFGGRALRVRVTPLVGLIDLNSAPPALLEALFAVIAGMPPAAAGALAQSVVDWRTQREETGRAFGIDVPEDLLLIPGFPYDAYARIAPLVSAGQASGGKINPLCAPEAVLLVLAKGNAGVATRIAAARDTGVEGIDLTRLDTALTDGSTTRSARITVDASFEDGAISSLTQEVTFVAAGSRAELPWRISRSNVSVWVPDRS